MTTKRKKGGGGVSFASATWAVCWVGGVQLVALWSDPAVSSIWQLRACAKIQSNVEVKPGVFGTLLFGLFLILTIELKKTDSSGSGLWSPLQPGAACASPQELGQGLEPIA